MLSVAGSRTLWLVLLVSAVIVGIPAVFGGVASAGTVDIYSSPGAPGSSYWVPATNTSGAIVAVTTPDPVWAAQTSNYSWISYNAGTGCNGYNPVTGLCTPGPQTAAATTITGTPTAMFYQTFTLTAASTGDLDVWADDTANVWLDNGTVTSGNGSGGTMLVPANATLGNNCSITPASCTQYMDAIIPLSLSAGTYTIVIEAYQLVPTTPFGVMYDGALYPNAIVSTPEPASYMLMGLGLAGLGTLMRRRKRA
jgi:PEP-CTERM motif-containing protein